MGICKSCEKEKCFFRGSLNVECPQYKAKPQTNADSIRAMSDEELATDLLSVFEEICEDGVPGKDWMLHWLKQPAEEGDRNG